MNEDLIQLINRHFPEAFGELIVCTCRVKFLTVDSWAKHLGEEVEYLTMAEARHALPPTRSVRGVQKTPKRGRLEVIDISGRDI